MYISHSFVTAQIGHLHSKPHVPQCKIQERNIVTLGTTTLVPAEVGFDLDNKG